MKVKKISALWPYAVLALAFCLSYLPTFLQSVGTLDLEETINGNLPKDLIDGLIAPVFDYRYLDWTTGQLTLGFLLWPFFLVFGKLEAVIKLLGAAFSLGTLWLWYGILSRYASRASAVFFSLLFLIAPPIWAHFTMITWGNHKESAFLTALLLWIFLRLMEKPRVKKSAFFLGAAAGFFIFFCFQNIISFALLTVLWISRRSRPDFKSEIALFFAGSVAALVAPFALYAAGGVNLFRFLFIKEVLVLHPVDLWDKVLSKLPELILRTVPRSFGFQSESHGYLVYAIFLFAFVFLFVTERKSIGAYFKQPKNAEPAPASPARIALLFIGLYITAYTVSGYGAWMSRDDYWFRYLIPLYPFIFATIALAAERLKRFGALLLIPVLLICFLERGVTAQYRWNDMKRLAKTITSIKGLHYLYFLDNGFSRTLGRISDESLVENGVHLIGKVTPEFRWKAAEVLGRQCGRRFIEPQKSVPAEELRPFFVRGYGAGLFEEGKAAAESFKNPQTAVLRIASAFGSNADLHSAAWEGVGMRLRESLLGSERAQNTIDALAGRGQPADPVFYSAMVNLVRGAPPDRRIDIIRGIALAGPKMYGFYFDDAEAFRLLFPDADQEEVLNAFFYAIGRKVAREVAASYFHISEKELFVRPSNLMQFETVGTRELDMKPVVISDAHWTLITDGIRFGFKEINANVTIRP